MPRGRARFSIEPAIGSGAYQNFRLTMVFKSTLRARKDSRIESELQMARAGRVLGAIACQSCTRAGGQKPSASDNEHTSNLRKRGLASSRLDAVIPPPSSGQKGTLRQASRFIGRTGRQAPTKSVNSPNLSAFVPWLPFSPFPHCHSQTGPDDRLQYNSIDNRSQIVGP